MQFAFTITPADFTGNIASTDYVAQQIDVMVGRDSLYFGLESTLSFVMMFPALLPARIRVTVPEGNLSDHWGTQMVQGR